MADPAPARIRLAMALLLPLLLLAAVWANSYRLAQQGQEWLIPIRGYDPSDFLRGQFIQYRYDWPTGIAPAGSAWPAFDPAYAGQLCIEGVAPNIARVRAVPPGQGPFDRRRDAVCAILVRATLGARREVRGLETGILYLAQSRAAMVAHQLADPTRQGFIRVRIRPDGVMRPISIEFRSRGSRPPFTRSR